MLKLKFTTSITFLFLFFNSQSQTTSTISLQVDKHHLNINYFPFDSIQVIDNRVDTTKILITEDGNYPPTYLNFIPSTSSAIKNYISSAVKDFPKGNKKLLISIKEFHIPNRTYLVQKKDSSFKVRNLRNYILFYADIYYQTADNRYKKILTINKKYYTYVFQTNKEFPEIFNNVIEASCFTNTYKSAIKFPRKLKYLNDTVSFNYSKDSNEISLEQINLYAKQTWSDYQIIKDTNYKDGFYLTFDDFRNNIIISDSIELKYDEKDSLYIAYLPNF